MKKEFTPGPWRVLRPSVGIDSNWHVTDHMDTFAVELAYRDAEIERLRQQVVEKDAHITWLNKSVEDLAFEQMANKTRIKELEQALRELLNDTQHKDHDCGDKRYCPVYHARKALEGNP